MQSKTLFFFSYKYTIFRVLRIYFFNSQKEKMSESMNTDYMPAELHGNLVSKGTGGNLSAHLLAFPIKIYMYIYNYTYWDGIILTDFILYTFLR